MKEQNHWHDRNTKDCKKIFQTTTWQKKGQPRENGQIFINIQYSKTESGRFIKHEQTNCNQWNWSGNHETSSKQVLNQVASQENFTKCWQKK